MHGNAHLIFFSLLISIGVQENVTVTFFIIIYLFIEINRSTKNSAGIQNLSLQPTFFLKKRTQVLIDYRICSCYRLILQLVRQWVATPCLSAQNVFIGIHVLCYVEIGRDSYIFQQPPPFDV